METKGTTNATTGMKMTLAKRVVLIKGYREVDKKDPKTIAGGNCHT